MSDCLVRRRFFRVCTAIVLSLLAAGGCGVAHDEDEVPVLHLSGHAATNGDPAKITVVEADYYSEEEAFLALLVDKPEYLGERSRWKTAGLGKDGAFRVELPKQHRYIGFIMFPPSESTRRRRIVFMRPAGSPVIFKLTVRGDSARAEKMAIAAALASMPASMAHEYPHYEEKHRFYDSINWASAMAAKVVAVSRSETRDAVDVEIGR